MDVRQLVSLVVGVERGANLAASWLLTYALHSTVWILFAWWLAVRRFMRRTPSGQHVLWTTSLVAGILTTTVQQAGFFTPLAGRWRVLDEARQALASVQVTVNRTGGGSPTSTIRARLLDAPPPPILPIEYASNQPFGDGREEMRIVWNDSGLRTAAPALIAGRALRVDRRSVGLATSDGMQLGIARSLTLDDASTSTRVQRNAPAPGSWSPVLGDGDARGVGRRLRVPVPWALEDVAQAMRWGGGNAKHAVVQAAIFPTPVTLIVVASWGLVVLALFGWLALTRVRLARLLRDRRRAEDTLAGTALRELTRVAGVGRTVMLSTTTRLGSPAALPGGEICLPSRVLHELTPLEQESLLAHELAHVVRGDTFWLRMARVVECVFFFQPLNRLARHRMQLAAEFAADQWAARVTNQPLRLAKCLARVAEWVSERSTVLSPAMVESAGSPLVQRVRRLAAPDAAPATSPRRRYAAPLALVGAAVAIIVVAPSVSVGANRDRVQRLHRAVGDADQFAIFLRDSAGGELRKNTLWMVRRAN